MPASRVSRSSCIACRASLNSSCFSLSVSMFFIILSSSDLSRLKLRLSEVKWGRMLNHYNLFRPTNTYTGLHRHTQTYRHLYRTTQTPTPHYKHPPPSTNTHHPLQTPTPHYKHPPLTTMGGTNFNLSSSCWTAAFHLFTFSAVFRDFSYSSWLVSFICWLSNSILRATLFSCTINSRSSYCLEWSDGDHGRRWGCNRG